MTGLVEYHPPERVQMSADCGVRIRPLTGRPYNMAECDGVVKVRFRDATGHEWTAPQAVWFQFDVGADGRYTRRALVLYWLREWAKTLPCYAGIEQVMVKAPREDKLWTGLRRTLVHGYLFAIFPVDLTWGTCPSDYPVCEGSNSVISDNIYYLASRAVAKDSK